MVLIHKIAGGNLVLGSKVMLMCRFCHLAADLLNTEGFEMMTREEFNSKFYCAFRGMSTRGRKVVLNGRGLKQSTLCTVTELDIAVLEKKTAGVSQSQVVFYSWNPLFRDCGLME
jgi:hypothetical protein